MNDDTIKHVINILSVISLAIPIFALLLHYRFIKLRKFIEHHQLLVNKKVSKLSDITQNNANRLQQISESQLTSQQLLSQTIQTAMKDVRNQIDHSFKCHIEGMGNHLNQLTCIMQTQLKDMTDQVNQRLGEGFNKNSVVFANLIKRLSLIDEAQKKISDLSHQVVDLQAIFQDKQTRGAFGEIQLDNLIANIIPKSHYKKQYVLSNQRRADCILLLPEPTGNLVIDAKFPLESYQRLLKEKDASQHKRIQSQFKQDIKKHIDDIAYRYISADETADSAIMFIPAEAIFAEIHTNFVDIVTYSHTKKVWLASPTTLMAILTTAQAVIKDDATRKQIDVVQQHLVFLAKDFQRFEKRMDNLSKHMQQASQDVSDINVSAKKISDRFSKIEQLDLGETTTDASSSIPLDNSTSPQTEQPSLEEST